MNNAHKRFLKIVYEDIKDEIEITSSMWMFGIGIILILLSLFSIISFHWLFGYGAFVLSSILCYQIYKGCREIVKWLKRCWYFAKN